MLQDKLGVLVGAALEVLLELLYALRLLREFLAVVLFLLDKPLDGLRRDHEGGWGGHCRCCVVDISVVCMRDLLFS